MPSPRAKSLLRERKRRDAFPTAVQSFLDGLFGLQAAFVESKAKRKVVHAGRRSGKTHGFVGRALKAARDYPGQTIPVFERTLTCVAAETFWSGLQELDTSFKLGIKFHHTLKTATLPNKAVIVLMGADTQEAADKARGGKFPVAFVDEAGTFRSKVLEYLLTEVLEPASIDFDGEIIVGGTPNPTKTGAFWQLTQSKGWERWHWTMLDNPTLGPADQDENGKKAWRLAWLEALKLRQGWTDLTPRFVREYLGQWADTFDDKIYAFTRDVNLIPVLPDAGSPDWSYSLALDLGYTDPTAFVVWARRAGDPFAYVVESYEQTELIPSAVAAHVERLRGRYTFRSIVADTGGYGKAVAEEMVQRYGIPVKAAAKRDKGVYIEHTNGDLKSGRIKVVAGANRELVDDLLSLGWNDDRSDSSAGARDHLPDAFLYGHRETRSWADTGFGEADGPAYGTPEWWQAEEDAIEEALEEQFRAKRLDAPRYLTTSYV